jgi:PAS domain S-box-containing protein
VETTDPRGVPADLAQQAAHGVAGSGPATGPAGLLQVLHDAPAAVLMIDLRRREVVYANAAAVELAGGRVRLPVDIDAWGDAAGLTDLGGKRMSQTSSPLSLVAAGIPVAGEPVAVRDAARRGSTATEEQREAVEGRLLWVTGFVLGPGAGERLPVPDELRSRALVVFLQLSGSEHGERRRLEVLRDRAVVATDMSFTISDPQREDDPLVWVNPSFTRLTGYPMAEAVGRNCRFLQGRNTDRRAVERIRAALRAQEPITEVLLNYRRDGTAFWNQVSISPVVDGAGDLVNFVGVQTDVTERVLVEQERRAALADAEEARRQLRLLAEATTHMTAALGVDDACHGLARLVVPQLADVCAVDLLDRPGSGPRRVAVCTRDRADEDRIARMAMLRDYRPGRDSATGHVLATGEPVLLSDLPEHGAERYLDDPAAAELYDRLRMRSAMVVPLRARGKVLGALTLVTQHPYGRRYGQKDLHLATDLAGRAGLTVDNARLYEREHAAAATLQHSLLPAVPEVGGLQMAARYRVGTDGNQVGGDWYDVLPLPDGAVGIAVGDVVGHDLSAAAAMGQLRGVLRSYAWDGGRPGSVLDRCDQLVQGLEMASMATAVYARLEPPLPSGERVLHYANAGHPAPLLLTREGELRRLDQHLSPMIGVVPTLGRVDADGRTEATLTVPAGALLLLYTDGLTDVAGEDADERVDLLERTLREIPADSPAEAVVDRVLAVCEPAHLRDDVAVLAVRLEG